MGCGNPPDPAGRTVIVWKPIGSWSGSGTQQTDPFENDTGILRVVWEARRETAPGAGRLRVALHSAVSGRELAVVVDHRGPGADTAHVNEDPRGFYLVIEATGIEWSVEVAEGMLGRTST